MSGEERGRFTVSMSPTIGVIAKALAAAQLAMGPAIKDRVGVIPSKDGRQGYQYGYATLAACFEAIQPLHAQGIAVTQIPLDGDSGVLVATLLLHESGEWIRGELWMPVAMQTPQGYGSALTYARRYGLSALCGLASDDDDGEEASRGPAPAPRRQAPPPSPPRAPDAALFAALCGRIDVAESGATLNAIAKDAQAAAKRGDLDDAQMDHIKRGVTTRRGIVQPPATNGGAS